MANAGSREHPFVRTERKQKMIDYMRDKNWNKILEEFDADEAFREPLLVWIRPSLDLMHFLRDTLLQLDINKVRLDFLFMHPASHQSQPGPCACRSSAWGAAAGSSSGSWPSRPVWRWSGSR